MSYTRFAIYYLPPDGALAAFGASWLGWDVATGTAGTQLTLPGLSDATTAPRKYGFHGTLKPPFRLADGQEPVALEQAVAHLATTLAPVQSDTLALRRLGQFLALTPTGDVAGLGRLAMACVTQLDTFREPADAEELARRRATGLTQSQEKNLCDWGYPYVLDEFRFHMTLTGRLCPDQITHWETVLTENLPQLPIPFRVDNIALVGERRDGKFALIQRYALTG